ncbi:MAG: HAMP domain-containing sensor histidine kinase, partial [Pseudomonadota bacterium]
MVRLELRDIIDPEDNDFARALAAFDIAPTPQAIVSAGGETLMRNEADRHLFGAARRLADRFREPAEAQRALRAALAGDGFSMTTEVNAVGGPMRAQAVFRRFRDPATGDAAVLCAVSAASQTDAEARARIAHDLRSPLNAIQGFAEYMDLAADNLTKTERSAYFADIQSACAAMLTLIETLVEDAAPPAEPRDAKGERLSLFQIADAVARLHRPRARRAGGDVMLAIEGDGEARGEPDDVRRIVDNLVDNAIRHGGGKVAITVRGGEIVVSDGGTG